MKTSADFTRDIIINTEYKSINSGDNFLPMLVMRYISAISPAHCNLINEILNNKLMHWKDNQEIYDYLKCILPKSKSIKLKYFKKNTLKDDNKLDMSSLSNTLEMSRSELEELLEYFPELIEKFKEHDGKILKSVK